MHIFLRCPQKDQIAELTKQYSASSVTQNDVGSTRNWDRSIPVKSTAPKFIKENGYRLLHKFQKIGTGEQVYLAAVEALSRGKCFDLGWVESVLQRPLQKNDTFCLLVRAFGFCSANFCRVVYREEQSTAKSQFFAIGVGTLQRHAAIGEERLSLNWNRETDDVHFLIDSYSQPSSWLAKLFAIYLRRQQLKFVDEAPKRLEQAVESQLQ